MFTAHDSSGGTRGQLVGGTVAVQLAQDFHPTNECGISFAYWVRTLRKMPDIQAGFSLRKVTTVRCAFGVSPCPNEFLALL